jgi:hypothetical protein
MSIIIFPLEIWIEIFSYLSPKEKLSCRLLDSQTRNIFREDELRNLTKQAHIEELRDNIKREYWKTNSIWTFTKILKLRFIPNIIESEIIDELNNYDFTVCFYIIANICIKEEILSLKPDINELRSENLKGLYSIILRGKKSYIKARYNASKYVDLGIFVDFSCILTDKRFKYQILSELICKLFYHYIKHIQYYPTGPTGNYSIINEINRLASWYDIPLLENKNDIELIRSRIDLILNFYKHIFPILNGIDSTRRI